MTILFDLHSVYRPPRFAHGNPFPAVGAIKSNRAEIIGYALSLGFHERPCQKTSQVSAVLEVSRALETPRRRRLKVVQCYRSIVGDKKIRKKKIQQSSDEIAEFG